MPGRNSLELRGHFSLKYHRVLCRWNLLHSTKLWEFNSRIKQDREKAYRTKTNVYSNSFKTWINTCKLFNDTLNTGLKWRLIKQHNELSPNDPNYSTLINFITFTINHTQEAKLIAEKRLKTTTDRALTQMQQPRASTGASAGTSATTAHKTKKQKTSK